MTDKTGGAAFPMVNSVYSDEWEIKQGMTLRDYFAAKAMQGILANHCMADGVCDLSVKWVADGAYRMADAMLKNRG